MKRYSISFNYKIFIVVNKSNYLIKITFLYNSN